jgi:hypothetical protein
MTMMLPVRVQNATLQIRRVLGASLLDNAFEVVAGGSDSITAEVG